MIDFQKNFAIIKHIFISFVYHKCKNKGVPVYDWSAPFCISEINIIIPITVKEAGCMKKLEIIIKPEKLEDLKSILYPTRRSRLWKTS